MTDRRPVAVVTDSTSDVPDDFLRKYPIFVLPAILILEGEQFVDGRDLSREDYYQRLPHLNPPPTTAAPSIGSFEQLYQQVFDQGYRAILSVHAPAVLSGIYNAAQIAAQSFDGAVQVLDGGQLTLGLGYQAIAAAECLTAGGTLQDAVAQMEALRPSVRLVAMLESLEYLRRSGRISWAKASLGALLNLKPFIELKDGVVSRLGETRTRRKGIARLHQILEEQGPLERLAILHTNALQDALDFREAVRAQSQTEPLIVNVTTIIGTHVGPNGLGFVSVRQS